jgi:uncharacterized protein involved in type VI secretion and phage assembly
MSLLDTLNDDDQEQRARPINGVVTGLVTNNNDPNGLGRVKVKLNGLEDNHETDWAPVATLMAGDQRGSFFLPEVNDEVLVAFEHGNVNAPYVVGALWNGKAKPPGDNGDGENNIRKIKSRCGHEIILDDTDQGEKVEIKTNAGHSITLDDASGGEKVEIQSKAGHKLQMDDSGGTVTIEDKNGNKIVMDSSGVDINDGKFTVSK